MSIWVRFGRVPVHCWNYLSNWQFIHFSRPANSLSKRVSTEFTTLFTELLHSWLAKTSVVAPANVQLRLQNSVTVFERTVKQITLPAQVARRVSCISAILMLDQHCLLKLSIVLNCFTEERGFLLCVCEMMDFWQHLLHNGWRRSLKCYDLQCKLLM